MEIQASDPPFWKKVDSSALLWGILFGYGRDNAYAFYWKYSHQGQTVANFFDQIKGDYSCPMLVGKAKRGFNNLEIPSFVSFSVNDPIVRKYEDERETIRKIYSHQDFLTTILTQLTRD